MICVACEIPKFTLEIVPLTDYVEQMLLLQALKSVGVEVTDAVVLLDRDQGGAARLSSQGIKLHRWQIVFIYLKNSNMIYLVICDWCNKGHCMSYSVSGMVHIKKPCCKSERVAHLVAAADFLSHYLSGPLPHVYTI